jgi:hypothetical protein
VAFVYCWNDIGIFTNKDFMFLRSGILPFTDNDKTSMGNKFDEIKKKILEEKPHLA